MAVDVRGFLRKVATRQGDGLALAESAIDLLIRIGVEKEKTSTSCRIGEYIISPAQFAEIVSRLIGANGLRVSKIEGIKALRLYTGCGLKEAKDAIDELEATL